MQYMCKFSISLGVIFSCSCLIISEKVLNKDSEDFDFDGLPGTQHEFKIDIPAGTLECFVQRVAEKGNIHIQYEVLRGGDRMVNFVLKDPNHRVLYHFAYKAEGTLEYESQVTGNYQLCIDNSQHYSSKLVYIFLVTVVMEEWTKYIDELHTLTTTVENFINSLTNVQKSIEDVKLHQSMSRMHVVMDWYLLTANNAYIMYRSILQIVIIVMTSLFQVWFVRRLFRVVNVTPTSSKPRA